MTRLLLVVLLAASIAMLWTDPPSMTPPPPVLSAQRWPRFAYSYMLGMSLSEDGQSLQDHSFAVLYVLWPPGAPGLFSAAIESEAIPMDVVAERLLGTVAQ